MPIMVNRLPEAELAEGNHVGGPARTRNVDYARELLGLHINVPWSAWEGYEVGSDVQAGVVWDYNRDTKRFTIHFPPSAECDDIGLTWEELLGEKP